MRHSRLNGLSAKREGGLSCPAALGPARRGVVSDAPEAAAGAVILVCRLVVGCRTGSGLRAAVGTGRGREL